MSETAAGGPIVVGVGEVLWDVLPHGKHLGGAPFNFAYHAGRLGARALVVSRVGDDDDGRAIRRLMSRLDMSDTYVQTDRDHPTGYVPVQLDAAGKPTFTIVENVAYDFLEPEPRLLDLAARAQVVCFGSLAQRHPVARQTIRQFIQAASKALRVYDINFRQHYYSREIVEHGLRAAHIVKLNEDELPRLAELVGLTGIDDLEKLGKLVTRFGLKLACLTLGPAGCVLVTPDGHVQADGYAVEVKDTVGSGDAFAAALVMGWLAGLPLAEIAERANLAGACVAMAPGATPPISPAHLEALAARQVPRVRAVIVNGCFRAPR